MGSGKTVGVLLALLCASVAFAAEAADRAAIDSMVRTLNEAPQSPRLFATGFEGAAELAHVTQNSKFSDSKLNLSYSNEARPTGVVISHEPMGEASWNPLPLAVPTVTEVSVPPRFIAQSVRFVAPDVALLDTLQEHYDIHSAPQRVPVLLVLKKEKNIWRIASVREMAKP